MRRAWAALALAGAIASAAGCAGARAASPAGPEARSETPAGATLETRPGERVTLVLRANPTTGYGWRLARAPDPAVLTLEGDEYVPASGTEGVPGAGGTDLWTFRARAAGRAEVVMEYIRPWESRPAETRRFTVVVR